MSNVNSKAVFEIFSGSAAEAAEACRIAIIATEKALALISNNDNESVDEDSVYNTMALTIDVFQSFSDIFHAMKEAKDLIKTVNRSCKDAKSSQIEATEYADNTKVDN
jgi:hemerythrin-like domain-containing protein